MRKIASILMILTIGLLIGTPISCGKNGGWHNIQKYVKKLARRGLTVETLTAKLKQKGLTVEEGKDIKEIIDPAKPEYLMGLYKLNQLKEAEINQVKELKLITIVVDDEFKKEASTESAGKIVIDYWASEGTIKTFVLKYAPFALDAHFRESWAYEDSKKIINLLSSRGINILGKVVEMNWREYLEGLIKFNFVSEIISKDKEGLRKYCSYSLWSEVKIEIGTLMGIKWGGGNMIIEIDYRESLEDIYSHILHCFL